MVERVTLLRMASQSRFVFRGEAVAAIRCGEAFGLVLPNLPCTTAAGNGKAALWLGPDEWLLVAGEAQEMSSLRASLNDVAHSLVDVSSREIGFEISGPASALLLNAAIALDLSGTEFPPGACSRTVFAKVGALLWRSEPDHFRLFVARSHADYAEALMAEAARSLPETDAGSVRPGRLL